MRVTITLLCSVISIYIQAQQTLQINVVGAESKKPVPAGILINNTKQGFLADSTGMAMVSFSSNGNFTLITTALGFEKKQTQVTIPVISGFLEIELESAEAEELEEVIVQSTRTSRTIANEPTRVETIELEEIDEKSNMRPANIAMILHESTGIQVQQTSATSGNASIRIQGLDGRYTQLLKDGFPNFGNFSSGLSVLEIPPLDLKQVEIIKGPASPLFGGGAIAGVINFISRTPKETPEYNFLINQSNIGQTNIGGFASGRNKKAGYTLLALYNKSIPYDVDNDDFTEVPLSSEITVHPRLFLYPNENTRLTLGNSFTTGERTGGDVMVITGRSDAAHTFFEKNKTIRNITTFEFDKIIHNKKRVIARQSFSVFDRKLSIPEYAFGGIEYNAYTDVSYVSNSDNQAIVLGGNFIFNRFREKDNGYTNRNNTTITGGLYGQHTWDASNNIKLESGIRFDRADYKNEIYNNHEVFVLPRISLLIKYSNQWSSRIGGGMGYKTPTLFTEETETIQFRNVDLLNNVKSEKSIGGTADVNFKTNIGNNITFTLNHMFFYTTINKPLVLQTNASGIHHFVNAPGSVKSKGFESNAKFIYRNNFKIFLGYTFTDGRADYLTPNEFLRLVPKSKLNSALIYEKEDVIKLGLEGYFTGRQYLSNGTRTPAYAEFGFMAEKIFKKISLYINFENFTDTRQSNYKKVVNGSHVNPTFDEIWTHTEGFVYNGGIKLRL